MSTVPHATYEVSFQTGSLGLSFKVVDGAPKVTRLMNDKQGRPQQAERLGVRPGDLIDTVHGKSVDNLSTQEIAAMIRCTPRPLKVTFRR